jgi:hypothetical protein
VYSRYNNSPITLPWGTPTLTGENSVYSVYNEVSAMQIGFQYKDIIQLERLS